MQQHRNIRIIISGGGTGGHIFPAIAIANALRAADSNIELLFVGAEGKMEMEKVPAAGYTIKGLPVAGFKRELSADNLSFPFKLMKSVRMAGKILNDFRPDAAVGVGGYASGPLLFMANRKGIPTVLQEQNSYPGVTNRLLSKKAATICVAYDGMEKYFPKNKIIVTGNPIRKDLVSVAEKSKEAYQFFNLDKSKPVLMITGGSQGARSINRSILAGLEKFSNAGIQVLWQTGKLFYQQAKEKLDTSKLQGIHVMEFISRMDLAYACADAVVARAGASTVSELCVVKKPAILVPLPTAAEDHQTKNCLALVEKNAGILVKDDKAQDELVDTAIRLLNDKPLQETLIRNIAPLGKPDAAENIASEILKLVRLK